MGCDARYPNPALACHAQGIGLAAGDSNGQRRLATGNEIVLCQSLEISGGYQRIWRRASGGNSPRKDLQFLSAVPKYDPACDLSRRPNRTAEKDTLILYLRTCLWFQITNLPTYAIT